MKKSEIDPGRTDRSPDKSAVLMDGSMKVQGFVVKRVEIRQYVERNDQKLGDYSLLTVIVETDRGTIEMKYDEGFRGADALEFAAKMLTHYSGLAALLNRALIELQQ